MPPKKQKNALIMVANVGLRSLDSNSFEEEPFLDKAKYAMRKLIEKKIFLQPKDEIGVITMGDENNQNFVEDVEHVKLYCQNLQVANWEMLKYVNSLTAKDYPSNWIEALRVALCFLNQEVLDPSIRKFVIIFNNFKEDDKSINMYDSDFIINDLKTYENLFLLFVGENTEENLNSESEKFALSIITEKLAQYEQINNFIEARQFHVAPAVSPMPWKCPLEWDGIFIPCATYVKITDSIKLGPWKTKSADLKEEVVKEKIYYDKQRNEISADVIINGYKFGGKYIPLSDEDEIVMKYCGSKKGLKIDSFVPQKQVKLEYWTGDGSRILVPDTNDVPIAFYSLLKAMVDMEYAAIVQKVYANNNLPKMGVLFPKADDGEIYCFVHIELPFVHDVRQLPKVAKESLKNVSKDQLDALDDFIDSMTVSENDYEYLNPGKFPNVKTQYLCNVIVQRALNPEETNLLPINDYIMKYLEPSDDLRMKAKPKLDKLNKLFGPGLPVTIESKEKDKTIVQTTTKDQPSKNQPNTSKNNQIQPNTNHPVQKSGRVYTVDSSDEENMSAQNEDIEIVDLDDL